jgi:hypothetical protein
MTVELVSNATGHVSRLSSKAFGKLLHLARLNGWWPEKAADNWPEQNWDTRIILPYIGPYMPGTISQTDAEGLKRALIKATATGQTALDSSVHFASSVLLQVARAGGFEVRFNAIALAGAVH